MLSFICLKTLQRTLTVKWSVELVKRHLTYSNEICVLFIYCCSLSRTFDQLAKAGVNSLALRRDVAAYSSSSWEKSVNCISSRIPSSPARKLSRCGSVCGFPFSLAIKYPYVTIIVLRAKDPLTDSVNIGCRYLAQKLHAYARSTLQ